MNGLAESGESETPTNIADIEVSLYNVRNFSFVLVLGLHANVIIAWLTGGRHLSVRYETVRNIMRYSAVVDLSLCALQMFFVVWSFVMFYTRSDSKLSMQCGGFGLDSAPIYAGVMLVASGVIVVARQTIMLSSFGQEPTLLRQNRMRVVKQSREIAVVGIVCILAAGCMAMFGSGVHLPMCYVAGKMTSNAVLLLLALVVNSVVLGAVVIARAARTDNGYKRQTKQEDFHAMSDKLATSAQDVERLLASIEELPDGISDSRWKLFVIVMRATVLALCILVGIVTLAGVFTQPVSVDTFFVLTGITLLTSVWSAYAMVRHWT